MAGEKIRELLPVMFAAAIVALMLWWVARWLVVG
jgi:hypothetical protein